MLTFGFYKFLTFEGCKSLRLGVTKSYVWVFYFLRLGVVNRYDVRWL